MSGADRLSLVCGNGALTVAIEETSANSWTVGSLALEAARVKSLRDAWTVPVLPFESATARVSVALEPSQSGAEPSGCNTFGGCVSATVSPGAREAAGDPSSGMKVRPVTAGFT